jgi:hypothetical protein
MTSSALPVVRPASCAHGYILAASEPNAVSAGGDPTSLYLCADCSTKVAKEVEDAEAKAKADEARAAKDAKDAEAQAAKDAASAKKADQAPASK